MYECSRNCNKFFAHFKKCLKSIQIYESSNYYSRDKFTKNHIFDIIKMAVSSIISFYIEEKTVEKKQ